MSGYAVNKGADRERRIDPVRFEAILMSMTNFELKHPSVVRGSRVRRIVRGSGTNVIEVKRVVRTLETKMMSHVRGRLGP